MFVDFVQSVHFILFVFTDVIIKGSVVLNYISKRDVSHILTPFV